MFSRKKTMESRVIFKKSRNHRNGYVNDDYIAEENEDGYSDEDDVFVEDPMLDTSEATKPLMHPRQRTRVKSKHPDCKLRLICKPVIYFTLFVCVLGGIMSLILYMTNKNSQGNVAGGSNAIVAQHSNVAEDVIGCDRIEVEDVWTVGIPKFVTESAVRLIDINRDGVLDIIMGFATGADGYGISEIVCDIYFNGTKPCFGGLIALEGITGKELWRQYSFHEIFGITCTVDFNQDGVIDCLGGGRAGAFDAFSGKDGKILWRYGNNNPQDIMNFYTAQVISDIDKDGIPDILAVHGGDPLQEPGSAFRLSGKLMLLSGKTGRVLKMMGVPDKKEAYYSPQVYLQKDGGEVVLFGTGGETHGGSLWRISLHDLKKGLIDRAQRIYTDNFKGVMTPPVLIDLNGDKVEDIVIAMFNSTILAIDGSTFHLMWNYTFPNSETYCTPSAGYYNDDDVPDFMVKYAYGPGFPLYYSAQTTVLDGRSGKPLISPPIKDTVGAQASPLTISVEGWGNDIFLYWVADCINHEGEGGKYDFVKGTNVHEQSRSDFCRLRFKTKGFTKMYAISSHLKSPGATVYNSEDRTTIEHAKWINTTLEAIEFVRQHPEHLKDYDYFANRDRQMETEKIYSPGNDVAMETSDVTTQNGNRYKGALTSSTGKKGGSGRPRRPYQQHRQNNRERINNKGRYRGQQRQPQHTGPVPGYPYDMQSPFTSYYSNGEEEPEYDNQNRDNDMYDPRYSGHNKRFRKPNLQDPSAMNKRSQAGIHSKRDNFKRYIKNNKILFSRLKRDITRRHVGPHDDEGLQRLISTGTVAPTTLPVDHPDYNQTIEIIFATYWFFPAKTQAILAEDQQCISDKLSKEAERMQPKNKYYGMDHDAYEHAIVQECLEKSGHDNKANDGKTYESQTSYNPYNVHMGQMTVYRLRIKCSCTNITALQATNKRCSTILPYQQQQWPAYMGHQGDSHWRPRS